MLKKLAVPILLLFSISSFAQTFKSIPENWQRDIAFVQKELPARHPDLFQKISKKDWDKACESLAASVPGKSDIEIALRLQEIVARVGDPHTALELTSLLQKEAVIPIGYGWYEGDLFVSASVKKFDRLFGAKILKINGLKAGEAMDRLARFVPRDNDYGFRSTTMQLMRFPLAWKMAGLATSDTLDVEAEDAQGQKFSQKIYPLDVANDRKGMVPMQPMRDAPDLRFKPLRSLWVSELHEADSLLVVQYSRCRSREMSLAAGDTLSADQLPEFHPFLDSVMTFFENHPNFRLFIDLRFNNGGGAGDGLLWSKRVAESPVLNQKGKVFVATNAYTLSAATQVALFFDRDTEAILIGEPTGDRPNHFGEVRTLKLPNSGLTLRHSTKFMRLLPKKDPDALEPEISIPLKFSEFLAGRDPILAFVKKYKP